MMHDVGDAYFGRLLGSLSEAQARWFVAREALRVGRGGVAQLHRKTGMSRVTITRGVKELQKGGDLLSSERVRRAGGGRHRIEVNDPGLLPALQSIMEESTSGDPMRLLLWSSKSTSRIAAELTRQGHAVSDETVRRKLLELDYSLQGNFKTKEGKSPPERDAQFRYIAAEVERFSKSGAPVLSIDAKKTELVGNFKNAGATWRPEGKPEEVNAYDFLGLARGKAIPYGAYDVGRNQGFVRVGTSHGTSEFAVECLLRWWKLIGKKRYPEARELLLCADGGGSNSSRSRMWKYQLQRLSSDTGLQITVCHYPPGTSKWNKIEHRMFSHISINWRGRPLINYATVISLIGNTTTTKGLNIRAEMDWAEYQTGQKVADQEMKELSLFPHDIHPQWNYTIRPRADDARHDERYRKPRKHP